jgi:hypothetical protein
MMPLRAGASNTAVSMRIQMLQHKWKNVWLLQVNVECACIFFLDIWSRVYYTEIIYLCRSFSPFEEKQNHSFPLLLGETLSDFCPLFFNKIKSAFCYTFHSFPTHYPLHIRSPLYKTKHYSPKSTDPTTFFFCISFYPQINGRRSEISIWIFNLQSTRCPSFFLNHHWSTRQVITLTLH